MRSAPTNQSFHAFSAAIEGAMGDRYQMTSTHLHPSDQAHVIPDDESVESIAPTTDANRQELIAPTTNANRQEIEGDLLVSHHPNFETQERPHPDLPRFFDIPEPNFEGGGATCLPIEDVDIQTNSDQALLLSWHYRLGHLSFRLLLVNYQYLLDNYYVLIFY